MKAIRKRIPGVRLLFVVATGLAVVGGYWIVSIREDAASREKARQVFVPVRKERNVLANPHPTELVREALSETADERQQWRNVSSMSVPEIKAALSEMQKSGIERFATSNLPEMLFYRWGELEPAAANAAASDMFPEYFHSSRRAVLTAWIKQGGAAEAWDAVKDEGEMWACTLSVPGEVAEMIVASLSDRNDLAAFGEVLRLNDENYMIADLLCRARAPKAFKTPESRAAFLAAAAIFTEPFVVDCAYENLFKEWAKSDLEAAQTGAATMPMTDELRQQVVSVIDRVASEKKRESERVADLVIEGTDAAGESGVGIQSDAKDSTPSIDSESQIRNDAGPGSWPETKERVIQRWEASPAVTVDFRLRDETFNLLERTSEADIEAWFRELALDLNMDDYMDVPLQLREMMLTVLVERGGETFVRSLAERPAIGMDFTMDSAMALWIKHDPTSVKAWLERDDLPQEIMKDRDDYRDDALDEIAAKNNAQAVAKELR